MISVDTNVIVRMFVNDDAAQAARSQQLIELNEVFIPDTVILEAYWVLRHRYQLTAEQFRVGMKAIMGLSAVYVRDSAAIALALDWFEGGLDFADAMHLALSGDSTSFVTFDRSFSRRAAGLSDKMVTLLQ